MTSTILYELTGGGIAVMTLNRAPVNALNPDFMSDIEACLMQMEMDSSVHAVVITSALKIFSAGLDLKEAIGYSVPQQTAIVDGLNSVFTRLYAFQKPVVAAVSGAAIAGGLFFVLSSDFTVAEEGVKLGLSEVRVGATFPVGPLEIARDSLSKSAFRRILLSGVPVAAEEAKELGFVDEICSEDQVLERAMAVARDYAKLPPKTYAAIKLQMRSPALATIDKTLRQNADPARDGWFSQETAEAMNAVLNRS